MPTKLGCLLVEQTIGHQFHDKKLLQKALGAAGAEGEGDDGNRQLALVGQAPLRLAIVDSAYLELMPRGKTAEVQSLLDSKNHLATAATQLGIASCIRLCPRSGKASTSVLALAMRAIIGAVWKDTKSQDIVRAIAQRLRLVAAVLCDPAHGLMALSSVIIIPGNTPIVPSPSVHLPATEPVTAFSSISVDPFTGMYDSFSDPNISSGLTYGENDRENIVYVTSLNPDQPYTGLNSNLNEGFDDPDSMTWGPMTAEFDATLFTENLSSQARASRSASVLSVHAGRKREYQNSIPSASNSSMVAIPQDGKRKRTSSSRSDEDAFRDYIAAENKRCENNSMSSPCDTYLTPAIQSDTMAIAKEKGSPLFRLLLGVCNASSIVALRATLVSMRGSDTNLSPPAANLSVQDRFLAIEASENQITSLTMLRRCHILQLWEYYCARHASRDGWVIISTGVDDTSKRPGNPKNYEKSQATAAVMKLVFPELTESSDSYASKYTKVKRLLGLGQKLSMLTQKFGQGLLGLIQCCEHDMSRSKFPNLSDQKLCSISVTDLEEFVPILERSQGDMLRDFSEAAAPMIHHILHGTVKNSQIFRLETIKPENIWRPPKGSQHLLAMLSPN